MYRGRTLHQGGSGASRGRFWACFGDTLSLSAQAMIGGLEEGR
ncbi:MAG: hypothetical protein QF832_06795 [SAR324 cluster bacterium]|nr:hypothetical protein [SAR324 cluster bacterium]MDP7498420.1 hypothetical protein [SAR324 cluster bacterium]